MSCTTAVPRLTYMYANLTWWCHDPSLASTDLSRLHGLHAAKTSKHVWRGNMWRYLSLQRGGALQRIAPHKEAPQRAPKRTGQSHDLRWIGACYWALTQWALHTPAYGWSNCQRPWDLWPDIPPKQTTRIQSRRRVPQAQGAHSWKLCLQTHRDSWKSRLWLQNLHVFNEITWKSCKCSKINGFSMKNMKKHAFSMFSLKIIAKIAFFCACGAFLYRKIRF